MFSVVSYFFKSAIDKISAKSVSFKKSENKLLQNKHIILIKRQDVINPGRFSMKCPFCGCDDTQVKDSRNAEDNTAIRRRRECPECGSRFTTFERIQLRDLIVVKKMAKR